MKKETETENKGKPVYSMNSATYRSYPVVGMMDELQAGYKRYGIMIQSGSFHLILDYIARLNEYWKIFNKLFSEGHPTRVRIENNIKLLRDKSSILLNDYASSFNKELKELIQEDLYKLWYELETLQNDIEQASQLVDLNIITSFSTSAKKRIKDVSGNDKEEVANIVKQFDLGD